VSGLENEYTKALFPDEKFLTNVRESRDNGFENVCSICGGGITGSEQFHNTGCPLDPEHEQFLEAAAEWQAKQEGVG
jgi:hypothetical protein